MKSTFVVFTLSLTIAFVAGCSREEPTPTTHAEPATPAAPAAHAASAAPEMKAHSTPPPIDVSGVKKAEGGKTIGELYADKANLAGKEVTVRGKVVKFLTQIMGKNWLHVRDGTGDGNAKPPTNDLTVTTDVTVKVGDTVLVSGKVLLDKDYGYGYKYAVIIEDAKVTPE